MKELGQTISDKARKRIAIVAKLNLSQIAKNLITILFFYLCILGPRRR